MRKANKNILRGIIILSFILLNVLIIFGISSLISYLNTGADRSKMLHTEIQKIDQYLPKMTWSTKKNQGRKINPQHLLDIENDYLDAWYVRSIAFQSNSTYGIDDYFTESARENLYSQIEFNLKENIFLESTSLAHNLSVEFFSEDGQLVALTDSNVIEYKQVYKGEQLILSTYEISTYQLVLLLEDGFWRIRHIVKTTSKELQKESPYLPSENIDTIKGINYYPRLSPWDTFGENFHSDTLSRDFNLLKKAGLNTIRVFVQYEDFGRANVDPEKINRLRQLLDQAEQNQIKVLITLFDFYGDYSVINWTLNQNHADLIVSELKDHQAILGWDIKNEPDLDFDSRGKTQVTSWLSNMIRFIRGIDSTHLITIGWSNPKAATLLANEVDFVSFHYYKDPDQLASSYSQLTKEIPNTPILLGEFGTSSYGSFWNLYSHSIEKQASYHKKLQSIFKEKGIPFMSWTLYDFETVPEDVVGKLPWRRNPQKQFGFIDNNGNKKPAFNYISEP